MARLVAPCLVVPGAAPGRALGAGRHSCSRRQRHECARVLRTTPAARVGLKCTVQAQGESFVGLFIWCGALASIDRGRLFITLGLIAREGRQQMRSIECHFAGCMRGGSLWGLWAWAACHVTLPHAARDGLLLGVCTRAGCCPPARGLKSWRGLERKRCTVPRMVVGSGCRCGCDSCVCWTSIAGISRSLELELAHVERLDLASCRSASLPPSCVLLARPPELAVSATAAPAGSTKPPALTTAQVGGRQSRSLAARRGQGSSCAAALRPAGLDQAGLNEGPGTAPTISTG
jgi:hypothetical protein